MKNKKAKFNYTLLDTFTAGIQLKGSEVKSIRNSDCSITEAHCYIQDNECYITGMTIAENKHSSYNNHEPLRLRKLLLTKKEIKQIDSKLDKGLTLIPLEVKINERGLIKLVIAIGKGKKLYDKREAIKERETKRKIKQDYVN